MNEKIKYSLQTNRKSTKGYEKWPIELAHNLKFISVETLQ